MSKIIFVDLASLHESILWDRREVLACGSYDCDTRGKTFQVNTRPFGRIGHGRVGRLDQFTALCDVLVILENLGWMGEKKCKMCVVCAALHGSSPIRASIRFHGGNRFESRVPTACPPGSSIFSY